MFEDIKLTDRGRLVVGILKGIGTAAVLLFFIISATAFMAMLVN